MYFNFKGAPNAAFLNTFVKPQLSLLVTSGTLPTLRENVETFEADTLLRKFGKKEYGVLSRVTLAKFGAWTSFTPAWTPAPSAIGNGTMLGYYNTFYRRFTVGYIKLTMGSTTAYGATQWIFTYPETAVVGGFTKAYTVVSGQAYDASAAKVYSVSYSNSGLSAFTDLRPVATQSTVSFIMKPITATVPFTWAVSDTFIMSFMIDRETF